MIFNMIYNRLIHIITQNIQTQPHLSNMAPNTRSSTSSNKSSNRSDRSTSITPSRPIARSASNTRPVFNTRSASKPSPYTNTNNRALALYIGAGDDTLPYLRHPEFDFVACDTRPCNEHGDMCLKGHVHTHEHRCSCCAPFVEQLKGLMALHGYTLLEENVDIDPKTNSGLMVFKKDDQTVKYYYNTPFIPTMNVWEMYKSTVKFSVLVLSGYFPHKSVIDLLNYDCLVIGGRNSLFMDHSQDRSWLKSNRSNIVSHMFKQKKYRLRHEKLDTSGYSYLLEDFTTGQTVDVEDITKFESTKKTM